MNKKPIPGKVTIKDFVTDIVVGFNDKYNFNVQEAGVPAKTAYKDEANVDGYITWFTNFTVNDPDKATNQKNKDYKFEYTVAVNPLPPNKSLYYLDGKTPVKVKDLGTNDAEFPGKKTFTLALGDPPIGIFP